jgi:hypothetical protein
LESGEGNSWLISKPKLRPPLVREKEEDTMNEKSPDESPEQKLDREIDAALRILKHLVLDSIRKYESAKR